MVLSCWCVGLRRGNNSFCLLNGGYSITNDLTPAGDHTLIHKFLLDCLILGWLYAVFPWKKPWYHFCFWVHCMPFPLCWVGTRWWWERPLKWFNHCLLSVSRIFSWLTPLYHWLVDTLCIHSRLRRIKASDVGRSSYSELFVLAIPDHTWPRSQSLHLFLIFFP